PGERPGHEAAADRTGDDSRLDLAKIKQRLLERLDELRADIRRELGKYDNEHYNMIAAAVADPGERSVADLLVD
ncbi:MAG: hypothetical protein GWO02_20385, partial [Gammaproteobacteria bacterium]|nr:hypothetical protein [Gammaproteobacteria bacterium]